MHDTRQSRGTRFEYRRSVSICIKEKRSYFTRRLRVRINVMEEHLDYYNPNKSGSFSGARRFPKQWLQSQDTYTLHKPVRKNSNEEKRSCSVLAFKCKPTSLIFLCSNPKTTITNISSLGQMALESTTCGIVHHARRTRAHCPTMVSSFKLSSGTVCLIGFSCRAGHIRKGKYKICGSYQVQDCTGRNGNSGRKGRSYQCSLALGRNHISYNYKYILVVIDVFSKKAFTTYLKSKSSSDMIEAFERVMPEIVKFSKLQTDMGREFLNRPFQSWLKQRQSIIFIRKISTRKRP